MATKKLDVPELGNLLGRITAARDNGELPKTERQHVQPVPQESGELKSSPVLEFKKENSKTGKWENGKTPKPVTEEISIGAGGRPTTKRDDVEYVKISPKIPRTLKRLADQARIDERFKDADGQPIKTLDELTALALERLLAS